MATKFKERENTSYALPLYRLILKLKSASLIYYCVNRSERKLNRIIYFTSLAKSIFICVEIFSKDSKYVYFFSKTCF